MRSSVTAYVGLGANLGDARATVLRAMQEIAGIDGVVLNRRSALYASAPVDANGPDYVNAVVQVLTHLKASKLLEALQTIETQAGRTRPYRNAPRTLDLDILLYANAHITRSKLTVPHPRMWERAFVLVPLAEIAPDCVHADQLHAVRGQSIEKLQ